MDIKRILLIKHDFDDSKDEYAMFQWALKYGQELIDTVITQQYEIDKMTNKPTPFESLLQVIKQFVGKE
jgi:hypothetical protein